MNRLRIIYLCLLLSSAALYASTGASPKLVRTCWFSHSEKHFRRVLIYLPAGYEQPDTPNPLTPNPLTPNPLTPNPLTPNPHGVPASNAQWGDLTRYPVLYLLHGINGSETSWQDMGGAIDTLESMIAAGRCRPVILVMPDCFKWDYAERTVHHNRRWKSIIHYPSLSREHLTEHALSDLIDMIDSTYCVHPAFAVAGLSDGARLAANIANLRPDRFSHVGLFSPVLHRDQLPVATADSTLSTSDCTGSPQACAVGCIRPSTIYHIYVGKQDFFYSSGKRFHRRLNRIRYPHTFVTWRGGHDWPLWRACLADFLSTAFPPQSQ